MTRTSQALKRLGVAALAVATIGAGVPALIASGASATNATNTGITITPTNEAGEANTCNPFTVAVTPADTTTVDIQITQTAATGTATIGFCDPGTGSGTNPQNATGFTTNNVVVGPPNTNAGNTCANPNNSTTVTCNAEYTTSSGTFTFGVTSNTVGTLNVTAYVETANTPATTFPNATGNNRPDGSERTATATKYVVANAEAAVTSLNCEPETSSTAVAGTTRYNCTAYSTQGSNTLVPVRGVAITRLVSAGPDQGAGTTCGQQAATNPTTTALSGATVYGTETNNQGVVYCELTNNGNAGTDTIYNYVSRNALPGPQDDEPADQITATFFGEGRFIDCNPETPTVRYGIDQVITCVVTDVNGNPVAGEVVDFQASFPGGRFTDNAFNSTSATTNAQGVATATINNPDQNSTQSQTVTATLADAFTGFGSTGTANAGAECQQAAGTTTETGQTTTTTSPAAGVCSDTITITYTNANNSPPPPTATPTSTTSPTTPPGCSVAAQNLPFTIQDADKTVGATAPVNVLIRGAQPGSTVELQAYQQNHYGTANFTNAANTRTAVANSAGEAVIQLRFSSNARMRAKQAGCSFGPNAGYNNAGGNVLYVRVALFMNVTRVGVRTYVISGDSIPARPGGLIVNIYCTDSRCKTPQNPSGIIAQPRANALNGEYTSARVVFSAAFQGTRVNILALLRGDAQNVAGQSNVRSLLVG